MMLDHSNSVGIHETTNHSDYVGAMKLQTTENYMGRNEATD